jgi:hypothetical protein
MVQESRELDLVDFVDAILLSTLYLMVPHGIS